MHLTRIGVEVFRLLIARKTKTTTTMMTMTTTVVLWIHLSGPSSMSMWMGSVGTKEPTETDDYK
jgi:hypothetical protein